MRNRGRTARRRAGPARRSLLPLLGVVLLPLLLRGPGAAAAPSAISGEPLSAERQTPSAGSESRKAPYDVLAGPAPGEPPGAPPLTAPALGATVEGIDFDAEAAASGFYHIPPDPNGAVGPGHLLSVVNTTVRWHTKAGVLQATRRLGHNGVTATGSFFEALSPETGTFDPKTLYDERVGRFLVVSLEAQDTADGDPQNASRILLAVSDDDDPNGSWHTVAIDGKTTINSVDCWADYPGLAADEEAVYITANMFSFGSPRNFCGVRLWIVDKGIAAGLYAGGAASVSVHDPYAGGGTAVTTQPAHVFGTPAGSTGTYLVSYSGLNTGATEFVQVVRVDDPLGTPTFTQQYLNVGDIENSALPMPGAPQPGTVELIDVNDRRALSAVWRNNALWMTAQVRPGSGADGGQATAHWWKIDATTPASLTLADQGNVGGEELASGTYTYYPAVSVDKYGNMGLGFSASAPTLYAGAYYTGRLASDPAGTTQAAGTLAAGLDSYHRAFGGTDNRWGDYSGIALDPADETTFWAFNEYALTGGTVLGGYPDEDGRWGTRWGSFDVQATPVDLVAFGAVARPRGIRVAWRTGSEADNAGFHLWRAPGGSGEPRRLTAALIPAAGDLTRGAAYAFVDSDVVAGEAYRYELEDVSTLGGSVFHGPVPALAGRLAVREPARVSALGAGPPLFAWRARPYDRFRVVFCAAGACAPGAGVRLPLPGGGKIRRTRLGFIYRPTRAEWRRVRRLAPGGGRVVWRVHAEDGAGHRAVSRARGLVAAAAGDSPAAGQ